MFDSLCFPCGHIITTDGIEAEHMLHQINPKIVQVKQCTGPFFLLFLG